MLLLNKNKVKMNIWRRKVQKKGRKVPEVVEAKMG